MTADQRRGEAGFTLIELLIAIMLSGILLGGITAGFLVTITGLKGTHDRFIESHGAQTLATYFTSDVQSAKFNSLDIDPSAIAGCAPSSPADSTTNFARLQWTENINLTTVTAFSGSYRMQRSGAEWQLARYYCAQRTVSDGVTNATATLTSATAAFTSADVGQSVTGAKILAGTTVAAYIDPTTVTMSALAAAPGSSAFTIAPLAPTSHVVARDLGDPRQVFADGAASSGSKTLSSASATFTSADVGLTLTGPNIPGGTTIASVTDPQSIVMSAAATGSNPSFTIGRSPPLAVPLGQRISLTVYALRAASEPAPYSYTLSATMRTPNPAAPYPAFKVTVPVSAVAGNPVTVTIRATTDGTTPDTNYGSAGAKTLTFAGPHAALNGSAQPPLYPPQPMTFASGSWTGQITLYDAETTALSVSDGEIFGTSDNLITVAPRPMDHFAVRTPPTATVGVPFNVTVKAQDQYDNTVTGYVRWIHFTNSVPPAVLPADYRFVSVDGGVHQFTVTLGTTGNQTLTVTDTASPFWTGFANVVVTAPTP